MQVEHKKAIAVFAHNEARNIVSCLESVKRAIRVGDACYVLNNGSTDDTGNLVSGFAKDNNFCKLVTLDMGDKSNAWNTFSHELGIKASTYIFMDGDCTVLEDAFDALELCLKQNPIANAAAAIPTESASKRNREEMLKIGGLAGNLYALSQDFMERIRDRNVRLPIGLIGDDSLLGALAYWDLNPCNEWDKTKIIVCENANFSYDRLSLFSFADMRLYYRRKIRYSLRRYQIILMRESLKTYGIKAIPQNICNLYLSPPSLLKLSWRGLDTWFDYLALSQIRQYKNRLSGYS